MIWLYFVNSVDVNNKIEDYISATHKVCYVTIIQRNKFQTKHQNLDAANAYP